MQHGLRRDLVVLACAISAGVHGALAPQHFGETTGAGLGFLAAALVLAALAVVVTLNPSSVLALTAPAVVFAGLLVSYALATTVGVPYLQPDPEPVDPLALVTKVVEVVGLLAASSLIWRPFAAVRHPQPKGT